LSSLKLALHGGKPIRDSLLPYGHQSIDEADIAAVAEVMRGDWLTQGPTIERFEQEFAKMLGAKHAVAFANGTAALHGACFAAGLGSGDEAIVPAMTFAATANAVLYVGGKPVFCDVHADSGLIDVDALEALLTPATKAVMPVHYAGLPVDFDPLLAWAEKHGLLVIEDACHAPGALYKDRLAGTFGDMACFSFHPVKPLTTGEGGMVVTDNEAFAETMRVFRTHGMTKQAQRVEQVGGWFYEMEALGFNYRLTDIQAALGISQLSKLHNFMRARQAHAAWYDKAFGEVPEVSFLTYETDRTCAYHLYPLLFDMDRLTCDKKTLFAALRAEGIGVQVHYIPVPLHPYYQKLGYDPSVVPQAQLFYEREISIPLFATMNDQDRRDVFDAVIKVIDAFGRTT